MSEKPRLNAEIPEELYLELQTLIPYGLKGRAYVALAKALVDLMKSTGKPSVVIGALLAGDVEIILRVKE